MNCIFCNNETKNPKFCSLSCAAQYNNKIPKRQLQKQCKKCTTKIEATRTYCDTCWTNRSNFEKLQKIHKCRKKQTCKNCGIISDEQNSYAGKKRFSTLCKNCTSVDCNNRIKNMKKLCIEYKGGKCIRCEYNKNYAALCFHHLDSKSKKFNIAHYRKKLFGDEIKSELDKCILLCSNCHIEEHNQ